MEASNQKGYVEVNISRTINTYAELWHGANVLRDKGCADRAGSTWVFMGAQLLYAFAVEAYCNFAMPIVFANASKTTMRSLGQRPPLCKLGLLSAMLDVDLEACAEEFQALSDLFELRNSLAHGKQGQIEHADRLPLGLDDYLSDVWLPAPWDHMCTPEAVARSRDAIEAVLRRVHEKLPTSVDRLFAFGVGDASARGVFE